MKKMWMLFLGMAFLLASSPVYAAGTELMESFSFRLTIIENGIEHQWEYDSPNHYEFESGERVIKGEKAKEEVERVLEKINLDERATIEELVSRIQQSLYPKAESVDIRYMNGEGKLFTWVWHKPE
ncbi:hypothetical protein M3202_13150 [Alkalihalobacillus oceani]|uniref:PepSY domain-containing protein n=1 Tax=Halalkalibacter oceani TaxID=1653776 RepID=A0A9X2DT42_9BACI|nr:hypothetical protein [Halalkalibacter oceani]MCM3715030.1 hypothetical protein [Halalkalibacter oceani]